MDRTMDFVSGHRTAAAYSAKDIKPKQRNYSIFELSSNFINSFSLIESLSTPEFTTARVEEECSVRWTCNTCNNSFDSLHDQRSHFKSDFHLFNVKLSLAGKDTVTEDDFAEWTFNSSVKDYDISTILGSEDEDREVGHLSASTRGLLGRSNQKIIVCLPDGEKISFWKCLLLGDSEKILFNHDIPGSTKDADMPCVTVREVTEKLLTVVNEPRNNTHLRVMLLASGGHFAGCVFDGNSAVTHKTFHRYVVRAKAGGKQSSEDANGNFAHTAGASIRRHNELSLKKDIRELLAVWKPYFDLSISIFIHAPSHNRQLLFDGDKPCFSCHRNIIRHIPLTVRRPTFKESQRLYKILTQISTEPDEEIMPINKEDSTITLGKENLMDNLKNGNISVDCSAIHGEAVHMSLPLHEAAKAGNAEKVLELLEQGFDPCVIDERGRTPYRLAAEREVKNTFRRFMALNMDQWDWKAAKVPSPLTKEMEESQNAKQAKKDAKRKARAKELKLLRKAREKKAQEEPERMQDEEREKVAAAAGKRLESLEPADNVMSANTTPLPWSLFSAGKVSFCIGVQIPTHLPEDGQSRIVVVNLKQVKVVK